MPKKITRTTKRTSTKIKATLRKRSLLKKQTVSKRARPTSKISKRITSQKYTKAPVPLTFTTLKTASPSHIHLSPYRPYWFMVQWQLSPLEIEVWKKQSLKSELALRLYSSRGRCVQSILIPGSVRNWHLYTETSDSFYVELGFINKKNQFICLCRSNSAKINLPNKNSKTINSSQLVPQIAFTLTSAQQKWIEQNVSHPSVAYPAYGGS